MSTSWSSSAPATSSWSGSGSAAGAARRLPRCSWSTTRPGSNPSAGELPPEQVREQDVDVVVLQRTRDLELVRDWLAREPGRDLPAVFLEHTAPGLEPGDGPVPPTRHPLADRSDIPIAHVTYFNQLFYDNGRAPTTVIEHGIVDPGERWTGELARAAVVTNEPVRREIGRASCRERV